MNRKMIVIEGLDGSGKSTQVELLKQKLIDNNIKLRQIKLPDYENPSSTLVKMYLGGEFGSNPQDVNIYSASLFYAVDRYASFKKFWGDDYNNGTLILADRYTTSNAVHQTVKLPKEEWQKGTGDIMVYFTGWYTITKTDYGYKYIGCEPYTD